MIKIQNNTTTQPTTSLGQRKPSRTIYQVGSEVTTLESSGHGVVSAMLFHGNPWVVASPIRHGCTTAGFSALAADADPDAVVEAADLAKQTFTGKRLSFPQQKILSTKQILTLFPKNNSEGRFTGFLHYKYFLDQVTHPASHHASSSHHVSSSYHAASTSASPNLTSYDYDVVSMTDIPPNQSLLPRHMSHQPDPTPPSPLPSRCTTQPTLHRCRWAHLDLGWPLD